MEDPLVSVVVSSYHRPRLLKAALHSVLKQTLRNIEVIVQDDSLDLSCEALVKSFDDERIRYTHNRPSLGTGPNLIAGFRKCRGKYFSTLNDDDLYGPQYLELMAAALEANPSYSLAFSDHAIIDDNGIVLKAETARNSARFARAKLQQGSVPNAIRSSLIDKCVPGMFAVYRAEAMDLEDFPKEVSSAYDYWLTYLAVRDGSPIFYDPRPLAFYRVHEASQTSSFSNPEERLRFLRYQEFIDRQFLADERLKSIWPDVRGRLAQTLTSQGFASLRLRRRSEALSKFATSLGTKLNLKAAAGIFLRASSETLLRLFL